MTHWLLAHWLLLAMGGTGVLAFLFPAISLPIGRWLLLTERGRYLLLATLVVGSFLVYRGHLIASVRADCVAEQAAKADRARADAAAAALARDTTAEVIGQKTQADTGRAIEQGKAATMAAQGRTDARIKAQPAVAGCAGPDPGVMSDVQASASRLRAAEDRMRRIGTAAPSR